MSKLLILFSFLVCSHLSFAGNKAADLLETVSKKYQAAGFVESGIRKETKSQIEFEAEAEPSTGKLFISHKLFRIDFEKPKKSSLIYDGNYIWDIPDQGVKVKTVNKYKMGSKSENGSFLTSLINKDSREKIFSLKKSTPKDGNVVFDFESKQKNPRIKSFQMIVSQEKKEISHIEYTDDVENKVIFDFSDTVFSKKAKPEVFKFKPTNGTQVNEL